MGTKRILYTMFAFYLSNNYYTSFVRVASLPLSNKLVLFLVHKQGFLIDVIKQCGALLKANSIIAVYYIAKFAPIIFLEKKMHKFVSPNRSMRKSKHCNSTTWVVDEKIREKKRRNGNS